VLKKTAINDLQMKLLLKQPESSSPLLMQIKSSREQFNTNTETEKPPMLMMMPVQPANISMARPLSSIVTRDTDLGSFLSSSALNTST
jgi:hypothetical protein